MVNQFNYHITITLVVKPDDKEENMACVMDMFFLHLCTRIARLQIHGFPTHGSGGCIYFMIIREK